MPARGLADLHLHTSFSDGWPSPAEVVDHVTLETRLDVIAITDHDTIEGALRAAEHSEHTGGVPVIVGEEVKTRDGDLICVFLETAIPPGLSVAETSQITGALLVFALLVTPAATAHQLTSRPGLGIALSVAIALAVTWLGLALAYFSIYPVGFYVTSLSFALYVLVRTVAAGRRGSVLA